MTKYIILKITVYKDQEETFMDYLDKYGQFHEVATDKEFELDD